MQMKRITKKMSKPAREFAASIFEDLHKTMKKKYRFDIRVVGSIKWNTALKMDDEIWDLDYQILLTNNSKLYKTNKLNDPTAIKNDFFNYFNDRFNKKNGFVVQNSTTAITLINNNSGYSFDFVIIKDKEQIIRRNNKRGSTINEFTWSSLPKYNKAYTKFNNLSSSQKTDLIENHILPRKVFEKLKQDNDPTKKSSCELFVEEVNNYVARGCNN